MEQLSAVVLTRNEEGNIADCLSTLQWADELLVLDSYSDDSTVEIARATGAEVRQRRFDNYALQRNAALEMASLDWVLFVDADERVTEELAEEIKAVIDDDAFEGWWVPRKNYIFGKWIRHAGWYPDYQLRLLRKARAKYDERREVHELVDLDGEAGYLQHHFVHYNYRTVREFLDKQNRYVDYEVRALLKEGHGVRPWSFVLQPLRQFCWRYLTLRGYRDGWRGLLLSFLMAYYELVRYRRLGQLQSV